MFEVTLLAAFCLVALLLFFSSAFFSPFEGISPDRSMLLWFCLIVLLSKVVGLVEELVVDNDPEYQWMDNFRQARTSNESRQSLLFKLDATVRRQLGKKVGSVKVKAGFV